jgi:threonine/homoserine/homoserine lactone efflux protein
MAALPFELAPIAKIVIGLVLIFVAARIVGFVIKVVGGAFIAYGAYQYIQASQQITIEAVFPAIVGIALIAVGKSMAETAIKVIGALVVLWGIVGLGII